jgi:flagellar hook-associated protein FlgK
MIMHKTKIDFQKYYQCLAFMSATKKGISACEMQRRLGHKRYTTIWTLMHRIRKAMGQRDDRYQLVGTVEFDEGFFEVATPENTKLKRGKESQKQQNVAVAVESTPLEDIETSKKSSHFRYAKMKVLKGHKTHNINEISQKNICKNSDMITDKNTTYNEFKKLVESHIVFKSTKEVTKTTLRWVHITISNAKRNLLGVYHTISRTYLQNYLNEFCYKLNRRYFGERLFDILLIACISANK